MSDESDRLHPSRCTPARHRKKRGILEKILAMLARDTLKSVCFAVGISAEGREKQVLVDRILAAECGDDGEADEVTPAPVKKEALALTPKTVLVFGAGFAKAFAPEAPLLVDHAAT